MSVPNISIFPRKHWTKNYNFSIVSTITQQNSDCLIELQY